MHKHLLFLFLLACLHPAAAADPVNLQCACVGAKTPAHQDREEIRKAFPSDRQILRQVFNDQTFYIIIRHRKIYRVLSGWQTGLGDEHLWAVMDQTGMLVECLVFPEFERVDMREEKIRVPGGEFSGDGRFDDVLILLQQSLDGQWESLLRRARLNLYQTDAVSQATP